MLTEHASLKGHRRSVLCTASGWGTNGILASGSEDCTVRIWDCTSGKCIKAIKGFSAPVVSIVFDKEVDRLYAASGNQVSLFSLVSTDLIISQPVHVFEHFADDVNQISLSDDGKLLSVCDDSGTVYIVDTEKREMLKSLKGKHKNICSCVSFRPRHSNECVSGGLDCTLVFWDFSTGKTKIIDTGQLMSKGAGPMLNPPMVNAVSVSGDGEFVAGGLGDGTAVVFTEEGGKSSKAAGGSARKRRVLVQSHALEGGHTAGIASMVFLPQNDASQLSADVSRMTLGDAGAPDTGPTLISGGNDTTICAWRLSTEKRIGNSKSDNAVRDAELVFRASHGDKINWLCAGRLSSNDRFVAVADVTPVITIYKIKDDVITNRHSGRTV